ncbi:uncharacterized protein LOC141678561 [Apium graveolens]|uniref:uncharacterized protein LOC141678561 n=1 Tax=Apium graveolens TaxID=4045 RepID=UPI003D7B620D
MLDPAISSAMLKATVKVRWTFGKSKDTRYWTGFIVGRVGVMVIVMTIAHDAALQGFDLKTLRAGGLNSIEVVFHGSEDAFGCYVECYIPKSEILLLSVMPGLKVFYPFKFASDCDGDGDEDGWNLENDMDVWTCSHPCALDWCIHRGYISRKLIPNKLKQYDPNMIMFDYTMGIGTGSSGSAVVNRKGLVVGMQSGQITESTTFLNGKSVGDALKQQSEASKNRIKPSLNLANFCFHPSDIQVLKTQPCGVKQAVHVKYIDTILRREFSYLPGAKYLSLNALIEQHVKISHYVTSSSGTAMT